MVTASEKNGFPEFQSKKVVKTFFTLSPLSLCGHSTSVATVCLPQIIDRVAEFLTWSLNQLCVCTVKTHTPPMAPFLLSYLEGNDVPGTHTLKLKRHHRGSDIDSNPVFRCFVGVTLVGYLIENFRSC